MRGLPGRRAQSLGLVRSEPVLRARQGDAARGGHSAVGTWTPRSTRWQPPGTGCTASTAGQMDSRSGPGAACQGRALSPSLSPEPGAAAGGRQAGHLQCWARGRVGWSSGRLFCPPPPWEELSAPLRLPWTCWTPALATAGRSPGRQLTREGKTSVAWAESSIILQESEGRNSEGSCPKVILMGVLSPKKATEIKCAQ